MFVLKQLVITPCQQACGFCTAKPSTGHEPLASSHQEGWKLPRINAVVPPAAHAIRNTWNQTEEEIKLGAKLKRCIEAFLYSLLFSFILNCTIALFYFNINYYFFFLLTTIFLKKNHLHISDFRKKIIYIFLCNKILKIVRYRILIKLKILLDWLSFVCQMKNISWYGNTFILLYSKIILFLI